MITKGVTTLGLDLHPVDRLLFRDARPFGNADSADSQLPNPQTLAGAIRTHLLDAFNVDFRWLKERIQATGDFGLALADADDPLVQQIAEIQTRGPWLARGDAVYMPAPSNLREVKPQSDGSKQGRLVRLDPLERPLRSWHRLSDPHSSTTSRLPLWRYGTESVRPVSGLLDIRGLGRYLEGGLPAAGDIVSEDDLFAKDRRVGIGVDPNRNTAADGLIYSVAFLALKQGVTLYAEVAGPSSVLEPLRGNGVLLRFGGEGRYVGVVLRRGASPWPRSVQSTGSGQTVLLTTPGYFGGWKPPDLNPLAAAVPKAVGVSGWDLAKGAPKANRFMVPAGSVYFLSSDDVIPDRLVSQDDHDLGWGQFVTGNWNYAR